MLPMLLALHIAHACAGQQADPWTMLALARAESGLRPYAIHVNGSGALQPGSAAEAAALARRLIAQGHSVDLGIAQINSRNLAALGLRVEDAFEPCRAFAAAARLLAEGYRRSDGPPQMRLRQALSRYNTGHPARGFDNGYVRAVERAALTPAMPPAVGRTRPPADDGRIARARRMAGL